MIDKRAPGVQAVEWLAEAGVTKCAFDAGQTTVAGLDSMRKALPGAVRRSFLLATDGLAARLRQVKDEDEIGRMRKAAALGCGLFGAVLQYVVPESRGDAGGGAVGVYGAAGWGRGHEL